MVILQIHSIRYYTNFFTFSQKKKQKIVITKIQENNLNKTHNNRKDLNEKNTKI